MKRLVSIFVFVLCMTAVSVAQDQKQDKDKFAPGEERIADHDRPDFRPDDLLTEEQREAFKTIRSESLKESKPLKYQLQEFKARHQTLIHADKPDLKAINANIDEMSKIEGQLAKIQVKARVEMMSLLTEEQKLQMDFFGEPDNIRPQREHKGWHHPDAPDFKDDRG